MTTGTPVRASNPERIYDTDDLAPGKKMIFACTG
jgi:hypothetical protein